jgi:hypothetical protein
MISFGRRGSRARKVYSLTAIIVITFIMFVIFSNLQTSWVSDDVSDKATLLHGPSGAASLPEVVMDDDGNGLAVWWQGASLDSADYASIYSCSFVDGSWGDTVQIDHGERTAYYSHVVMDGDGLAIAVWSQEDDSGYMGVYANIYRDGIWTGALMIDQCNGSTGEPFITMDDEGDALVIWSQSDGSGVDQVCARQFSDGIWGDLIQIANSTESITCMGTSMNDDGNAVALWFQSNDTGRWPYAALFSNGSWGQASIIGDGCMMMLEAEVCIAQDGTVVAVWGQLNESYDCDVLTNAYLNGSWTGATVLDEKDGYAYAPDMAMDDEGNVIAVWSYQSISISVHYSIFSKGSWSEVEAIDDLAGQAHASHISMNENGDATVAWAFDPGSGSCSIGLVRYSNGSWGEATVLDEDLGGLYTASVAMNEDGSTLIAWLYADADGYISVYATPDDGDGGAITWLIVPAVLIAFAVIVTGLTSWKYRKR